MNTIGIICEYNPFHKGHAYQLEQLHTMHPQATRIAIMSGAFVQRGEPAYFSKFDRARWAILSGADVVIELPTIYALGSAEIFSTGAVRLMKALHIEAISFGTELDNLQVLKDAATLMNSEDGQRLLREEIKKGASYGAALRHILCHEIPDGYSLGTAPNAILGLEYIRSAQQHHKGLEFIPIHRTSSHHESTLPSATNSEPLLPSGTALRKALITGSLIYDFVPLSIVEDLRHVMNLRRYVQYERYHTILHGIHRLLSTADLATIADFTEGIEHRWRTMIGEPTWLDVLNRIKTKRYTYARLQRMAMYGALHLTKDLHRTAHREGPQYARLLAFNNRGRQWLKTLSPTVPIIQKWAKAPSLVSSLGKDMLRLDESATDLQALTFLNESMRKGATDYTYTPQYIQQ